MRAGDDITNYLHILNSEYLSQLLLIQGSSINPLSSLDLSPTSYQNRPTNCFYSFSITCLVLQSDCLLI